MKINKAIRVLMRNQKISLNDMGKSLTKVNRNTGEITNLIANDVSARLTNDNFSFDKAVEMLDVLEYNIVLQKKSEPVKEGQLLINQLDEKPKPNQKEDIPKQVDKKPKSNRIKLINVDKKQSKTLDELLNT